MLYSIISNIVLIIKAIDDSLHRLEGIIDNYKAFTPVKPRLNDLDHKAIYLQMDWLAKEKLNKGDSVVYYQSKYII